MFVIPAILGFSFNLFFQCFFSFPFVFSAVYNHAFPWKFDCLSTDMYFVQGRYDIMRNYMPKVGSLGLDMMFRTCTVQVR
jgi:hypothetical protein